MSKACEKCDTGDDYHLVAFRSGAYNVICVQCDLSSNYIDIIINSSTEPECKPVSTKIENCAKYNTLGKCSDCKDGYQLYDQTCEPLPNNCSTMGLKKTCSECDAGYFLSTEDTCQKITIPNCSQVEKANDTKCKTCDPYYIVKEMDKSCIPNQVANCLYGNDRGCVDCEEGYLKKSDGSVCTKSSSCKEAFYKNDIKCVECNYVGGYFATDVNGIEQIDILTYEMWEQVCTKFAKIFTVFGIVGTILIAGF